MKKFIDNFILVFFIFMPILYVYMSFGIKIQVDLSLLGFVLTSFFFLLVYIYLFMNKVKPKLLIGYLIFMILSIVSTMFNYMNTAENIINILTILYFPIFVLFFTKYENKYFNKKFLAYIYLIYAIILTVCFFARINIPADKQPFVGIFYANSIISPILAILMPLALNYISKTNNILMKLLFVFVSVISVIFVGTKTIYAASIIYVAYCLFLYFKKKPHIALMIAIFSSAAVVVLPLVPQYQELRSKKIYSFKEEDSPINITNFDKALFDYKIKGSRIEINTLMNRRDRYRMIFSNDYNKVNIDLVDILLTLGVVSFIFYLGFAFAIVYKAKIKGLYKLLLIMIVCAGLFQGNIFTNYLVYLFIASLFMLARQPEDEKRILLISNMYPSKKNQGYGIFVKNTYDALNEKYIVNKITIGKHNNKLAKLFAYIYLHGRSFLQLLFVSYDFVYIHFVSHSSTGAFLAKPFVGKTKYVINVHGNDIVADTKEDEKNVVRAHKYLKKANQVIVPSEYYANVVINEYGVKKTDVTIYPSGGIDLDLFRNIDVNEAKEHFKLDKKVNYIGYISRLEKDKGYDTFVEAINVLSQDKKYDKYKFIIAGFGSEEPILNELIKKYKLKDRIVILDSFERDEIPYLYNALDIFVFPTRRKSESLGLVGLEAMACETLVISSDAKGPLSYVENKKNAFVFKQDDYNDLVNVIEKVVSLDKKDVEKIKKNAIKTVEEYDSKNMNSVLYKAFR